MSINLKRKDWILICGVILIGSLFFIIPGLLKAYMKFNIEHGMILSFIKFAILSTLGEMIALRITSGNYYYSEFSLMPRAIIWGILGVLTYLAFILFSGGVPVLWKHLHLPEGPFFVTHGLSIARVVGAFSISLCLNLVFTPTLFIAHAITNVHIQRSHGSIRRFFSIMHVRKIMTEMNWVGLWDFALKKTIPFFWIPAHTVTFLLPPEHRILAAALLSIMLGVFLALSRQERTDYAEIAGKGKIAQSDALEFTDKISS